ncbi:recombinase family protein [Microbacterium sp.]|uniref:recombinase family protein n=1 Tax=Microbacterium sp. TaxID=51671 RepID=UPI003C711A9A
MVRVFCRVKPRRIVLVHGPDSFPPLESLSSPPARYAVLYLRVSTTEQARKGGTTEGFSIPAQRELATKTVHRMGAFVVKEFVDSGRSGTSANRPGLQRMLTYVGENPVDYVVVHKLDRLARNRADDSDINTRITESGATLVSCSESIDPTRAGNWCTASWPRSSSSTPRTSLLK